MFKNLSFKSFSLSKKTILIFSLVFAIFAANQIFVLYIQMSSKDSSMDAINAAGRNRTLSQRISAASFQILNGDISVIPDLEEAITFHDSTLKVLKNGGVVPGMDIEELEPVTGEAIAKIKAVEELWIPFKSCASLLLDEQELLSASKFIGENYTPLLKANNALVQALLTDEALAEQPHEVQTAVVNIAGRNRMLSQRIGLMAFKVMQGDRAVIPKLEETINLHDKSFTALVEGGLVEGATVELPSASPALLDEINAINAIWMPYKENAKRIVGAEEFLKCIDFIAENYAALLSKNNDLVKAVSNEALKAKDAISASLIRILISLLILTTIVILIGYFSISKYIVQPMKKLAKQVETLSFGKIPETIVVNQGDDVGALSSAVNKMVDNIQSYSSFTEEIGKGNFEYEFKAASEDDQLGESLLNMRNQLKSVEAESKIRNWKTEGLAKFADILRISDADLAEFSQEIITNVVKYVEAVQGAIYVLNDVNPEKPVLERKGSYAYGRPKFIEESVGPGEGIVGQVMLERKHIFMTNVPNNFMRVTSGLGEAEPTSVIVFPVMVNEEVMGVMELASFEKFTNEQIDFLLTLSESIAATLKSAKVNENTKTLLIESKSLEENLKSQEEELRQTMEEMQATQDSMESREDELLKEIDGLKKQLRRLEE